MNIRSGFRLHEAGTGIGSSFLYFATIGRTVQLAMMYSPSHFVVLDCRYRRRVIVCMKCFSSSRLKHSQVRYKQKLLATRLPYKHVIALILGAFSA